MSPRVAGLDGFKEKWVAVVLDEGGFAGAQIFATAAEAFSELADCTAIGIDVPIGLPAAAAAWTANRKAAGIAESPSGPTGDDRRAPSRDLVLASYVHPASSVQRTSSSSGGLASCSPQPVAA